MSDLGARDAATRPRRLPGRALADERTDLAWNRSGLALLACGVVLMRGFTLQGLPPAQVATGAVVLGLGVFSYVLAAWHAHMRLRPGRTATAARAVDVVPVAAGIAIVGVAALVLGVFFPS